MMLEEVFARWIGNLDDSEADTVQSLWVLENIKCQHIADINFPFLSPYPRRWAYLLQLASVWTLFLFCFLLQCTHAAAYIMECSEYLWLSWSWEVLAWFRRTDIYKHTVLQTCFVAYHICVARNASHGLSTSIYLPAPHRLGSQSLSFVVMMWARQGEPPAKDPPNSQAYIQTYIQAYIQIKADTYLQAILTKTKQTHTQQRPPNSTPQNKTAKKYYLI